MMSAPTAISCAQTETCEISQVAKTSGKAPKQVPFPTVNIGAGGRLTLNRAAQEALKKAGSPFVAFSVQDGVLSIIPITDPGVIGVGTIFEDRFLHSESVAQSSGPGRYPAEWCEGSLDVHLGQPVNADQPARAVAAAASTGSDGSMTASVDSPQPAASAGPEKEFLR